MILKLQQMKKNFLVFLFIITCFFTCVSHEINAYRMICLDINDNPYGIEKRLREEFMKQGFQLIDHEFYETLDADNKSKTLFLFYDYFINYNGPSTLNVVLKNASGKTIWEASGQGNTFLSASGDMKGASKQIMRKFSQLSYKFDKELVKNVTMSNPFFNWNEDSVKTYLNSHLTSDIEGIYKNYSNDGNAYKIAILKNKDKYVGIIVDADNKQWTKGEIKITLNYIEGLLYDAEYFDANHKKLNALAGFEDNRLLQFTVPNLGDFSFLKIYPSSNEQSNITTNRRAKYKATGSGVLISSEILITNYHVIKDAEKVEAVININGIPESFSARVLCSDKTNDLALVCIKDENYTGQKSIPFKILNQTVDVGTSVFTMGFPLTTFLGDEVKITDGIISSKSGFNGDIVSYQISAAIQPGNSGGPLFDKNGNLVGITNAAIKSSVAENVGYAIKSTYILNLIDSAPINIPISKGETLPKSDLPTLVKKLTPYVVYLKIY